MKIIAMGTALAFTVLSWSAMAEEQKTMQDKPSIEDQCRAMAEQHGMKGDKVDAWVKKCLEMAEQMHHNREMGDDNARHHGADMSGGHDMEDAEEGNSGMGEDK